MDILQHNPGDINNLMDNLADKPLVTKYQLMEDSELRLEVGTKEVIVELLVGMAEIFGTALTIHKRYTLPQGFRAAIFSYKGAEIEVVGKVDSAYIAQQTPMVGKTTLCRILCNYAVREGWFPTFVDLDVGQRSISVPGSIASLTIEKSADIVDSFDRKAAYVLNFGSLTPSKNLTLYDALVKELGASMRKKLKGLHHLNASGSIINTCGWIKGEGYATVLRAAESFEPDVIIVLDHERMYNQLVQDLPSFLKILHLPKSGGVEARSKEMRAAARQAAIHRNFYGTKSCPYFPHSFEISYDAATPEEQELQIGKFGADQLPESCLPLGTKAEDHKMAVVPVPITPEINNHLVALMPPGSTLDDSLLKKPCLGYIAVTNVDTVKKMITVLSPQPYPLPSRVALLSDIMFIDDNL